MSPFVVSSPTFNAKCVIWASNIHSNVFAQTRLCVYIYNTIKIFKPPIQPLERNLLGR